MLQAVGQGHEVHALLYLSDADSTGPGEESLVYMSAAARGG